MRTTSLLTRVLALALIAHGLQGQVPGTSTPLPRDPARETELLKQVKVAEGFRATLFAGPPVAMYPTCLTGTIDGAVFVCVDPNLSLSGEKGKGRVIRLVDNNQDGMADTYTTFAQMDSPRGLIYDGTTLYVMHPPTLTAYRDSNNDGVADTSVDLVKGIGVGLAVRTADHGTNGITLGIDGWIYVAVGDYGFREAVGSDGKVLQHHGGGVARVRTDGTGLEMTTVGARNMYDVAVDPLLHVFSRDNTNDGDGWETRLHYLATGANLGYPMLYKNFSSEHLASLAEYGAGSGTGGLWVNDPGFPEGFNNTLYTGDWTVNKVFRHPLTPSGGSFKVQQEVFLTLPHPTDMAMDGQSNMYVASLAGGSFTYIGDSVGYVVRVSSTATKPGAAPKIAELKDGPLRDVLSSGNSEYRLQAQREILRRGENGGMISGLQKMMLDQKRTAYTRVAAMFTLRQLIGDRANSPITEVAKDPAIRALALRALADNRAGSKPVSTDLFIAGLTDASHEVQLEAIGGLVRMNSVSNAGLIVPLTASPDPTVSHVAINALVALHASNAALAGLDHASSGIRAGSLRALQLMHDAEVTAALVDRMKRSQDPATKRDLALALARLYYIEAPWNGDWWGTKPSFIGPYFAPMTWEGSAMILPPVRALLLAADASEAPALIDGLIRNRMAPQGSRALLLALGKAPAAQRTEAMNALIGTQQLSPAMQAQLAKLDAAGGDLHVGVATLLASETSISPTLLPMVRSAILDRALGDSLRAKLLGAVAALQPLSAAPIHAEVNPVLGGVSPLGGGILNPNQTPIDAAWRRYVGDRKRATELDYFVELVRTGTPAQRILGYSVLLQSVRGARVAQAVTDQVAPVLEAAWGKLSDGTQLVTAITIMRLEAQYTAKLEAFRSNPPQPPKPPVPMDWVQLFNGKDLSNWDIKFANHPLNENFNNTFRVENGMLTVRYDNWTGFAGEFGHIFTKQQYSYYIVAAEYRFVGEQVTGAGAGNSWAIRNNGIMLHSQSAASMGLRQDFPISLEVQLLGGLGRGKRTTGNLCTPGTNIVMNDKLVTTHCINSTSQTYDGDQWVRVEVLVLGDSIIKHIVNGDTVLTYSKPQMGGGSANNTNPGMLVEGKPLTGGYITLQAETAPIEFRKVELVNLVGCMDPKAANYKSYYVKSDPAACKK